jgi:hypothetical protein
MREQYPLRIVVKLFQAVKTFKLAPEFDQVILDKCLFFASYYGFVCDMHHIFM